MRTDWSCRVPFHLVLLVLTLVAFLPARAQTTVWVDDCAGTGTGTQGDPYCKIQTAICSIKTTGGTINVLPGTYREAIRVTANITIISTDGPAVTTLDATGKPCPTADFCTIGVAAQLLGGVFPVGCGIDQPHRGDPHHEHRRRDRPARRLCEDRRRDLGLRLVADDHPERDRRQHDQQPHLQALLRRRHLHQRHRTPPRRPGR